MTSPGIESRRHRGRLQLCLQAAEARARPDAGGAPSARLSTPARGADEMATHETAEGSRASTSACGWTEACLERWTRPRRQGRARPPKQERGAAKGDSVQA
eukprot:12691406-Alexandrium_andersonii.AAC.1